MTEYWKKVWREHAAQSDLNNPQAQVMRTWQGQPVSETLFAEILKELDSQIALTSDHEVLDLCGGNGLISIHLAPRCRSVVCVDATPELLALVDTTRHPNITTVPKDALSCGFREASFDRVILYAAIQYFDYREVVQLFRHLHFWLRPAGMVFVGDVPDAERIWRFFDTPERVARYFDGVATERPVIGTWFSFHWLEKLARSCGFVSAKRLEQPSHWPYAHFRYDALFEKAEE